MYELFNIKGSKPPIEDFTRLQKTKILVITTPDDPIHKDDDVKIVNKLREEGCNVEFWDKGMAGTEGNSHMLIVEKNNAEIFEKIATWLRD
jgi:non-ribosomal peptide synthetase component E (peptide arylation enzyme)